MKSGKLIRQQRVKLGMSQSEVSRSLGYTSPQLISNTERGKCAVPIKQVFKISKILKISPLDLKKAIIADAIARIEKEFKKARFR